MKVRDRKSCSAPTITSETAKGTSMRMRQIDVARYAGSARYSARDEAVIDAEDEDQRDLGDEQNAEEEGEAAERLLAAALEGLVIDPIDRRAQQVEGRQRQDSGQDRIEAEAVD